MTQTAEPGRAAAPGPTRIVFGTDGWRARVADEFTLRERPPLRGRRGARTSSSAGTRRRASSSPTTGGSPRSTSRRAAAEVLLAHDIPVAISRTAVPTQMSSYEVVQRGAAAGHRDHGLPQPVDRQRVQGQVADRARRRARTCCRRSRRRSLANGGLADRPAAARGRRGGRARRVVRPVRGLRALTSGRTLDLDALRAADVSVLVEPLYGAGSGWIPRLLAGGRIRVTEIHNERNPYFGGINPEPIRPNVDEALAMIAGGGFDLGLLLDGDADRAGRGRRAGHVPPPARGHRPAHVLPRRAPRAARPGRRVA